MKCENFARFPLSKHFFRTHYSGGESFDEITFSGYTPDMLKKAYSFLPDVDAVGMKICVVCAFDNIGIVENMKVFCESFSLLMPEMSLYYPQGKPKTETRTWLLESSLDTQWACVFAPRAEMCVVFAKDNMVENLLAAAEFSAKELSADVVSMSFGTEESGVDEKLARFMSEYNCIFTASSGDVGGKTSFPSTSPYCVSVGGSDIVLDSSGKRILETAWINGGGGKSDIFEISPWQARFYNIYGMTEGKRGTPDVAMTANESPGAAVYVSQLGGWTTVGGTSLAAACFSGICACIKKRNPKIKSTADMLYYLYGKAGVTGYDEPQYNFHDITFGTSGEFFAQEGWDFTTGLGSPVISQLA